MDRDRVDVVLMPVPVPWRDLEGPCATNRFWPQATEVCRTHVAHLVLSIRSESRDLVGLHLSLSDLIAAILEVTDASAVFWGAGTLVQPRDIFMRFMEISGPDDLPLHLWVDFRNSRKDDGSLFLATSGLEALGQKEIEGASRQLRPEEMVEKVFNLAHHICTRHPIINDGDTMGGDEHERIQVTYRRSV